MYKYNVNICICTRSKWKT